MYGTTPRNSDYLNLKTFARQQLKASRLAVLIEFIDRAYERKWFQIITFLAVCKE